MNAQKIILNQLEYILKPSNLINRLKFNKLNKNAYIEVPFANKMRIRVRLCEPVGKALFNYNVYDLAMSEALYRLTEPNDSVLDVGANIGYTSLLMSLKTSQKNIYSFEPHPTTFEELNYNIRTLNKLNDINLFNIGLSSETSEMTLVTESENHRGGSRIDNSDNKKGSSVKIKVEKLDNMIDFQVGVMKIDVEGHELEVFKGAEELLSKKMIRDIIFEEHEPYPSATYKFLEDKGYEIHRIAKSISRPLLIDKNDHISFQSSWEPANYLATIDPKRATRLFNKKGWNLL